MIKDDTKAANLTKLKNGPALIPARVFSGMESLGLVRKVVKPASMGPSRGFTYAQLTDAGQAQAQAA